MRSGVIVSLRLYIVGMDHSSDPVPFGRRYEWTTFLFEFGITDEMKIITKKRVETVTWKPVSTYTLQMY